MRTRQRKVKWNKQKEGTCQKLERQTKKKMTKRVPQKTKLKELE